MNNPNNQVTITDINMPFWSMVRFLVKAALASIPAMIIVSIAIMLFWGMVYLLIAALFLGGRGIMSALDRAQQPAVSGGLSPVPAASVAPLQAEAKPQASAEKGYVTVRREDFGDDWPLTVDKARMWCEPGNAVLLISNSTIYKLNGAAATQFPNQYEPIDEIWAVDETGSKKDLGALIGAGLKLCK